MGLLLLLLFGVRDVNKNEMMVPILWKPFSNFDEENKLTLPFMYEEKIQTRCFWKMLTLR